MKIALGTDHRGFKHKEKIKRELYLPDQPIEWIDMGCTNSERTDYPPFAQKVCKAMQEGKADKGILLCSSGIGMSIAANRFAGIYAALVWNERVAAMAKQDDNANILVLPSDFLEDEQILPIILAWLESEFKEGRYKERIAMIDTWGGIK